MNSILKGALAIQFAIAGVAVAQNGDLPERDQARDTGLIDIGRDQKTPAGTVRASTLIGTEVYNHEGKHLGEIKDIVLDDSTQKVGYVVLSYGGIVGLGDKLFALPHKMVRHSEGENRMTLALDENVLKNAPGFDQSKWPTEANADYYQKLDAYYKEHDERRAEAAKDRIDEEADRARDRIDETARAAGERLEQSADQKADELERTGEKVAEGVKEESKKASDRMADAADDARLTTEHDVTAQPAAAQIGGEEKLTWNRRVSSLIGANVENSQGENLGEVHDLVLDWDKGEVRYAVLSYGGILGIGDKLFAVPIDAFSHQQDSSKLVLDVSKEQLKSAPGFNKDQWPNMADPQWSNQVKEFYQQDRPGREQAD